MYHPGLFWNRNESAFDEDQRLHHVQAQSFVRGPIVADRSDTSTAAATPASGVLRSVLLKNLRGEHGINYVHADAAVVLISLRQPESLRDALHEQEFFRQLWQVRATARNANPDPDLSARTACTLTALSVSHSTLLNCHRKWLLSGYVRRKHRRLRPSTRT